MPHKSSFGFAQDRFMHTLSTVAGKAFTVGLTLCKGRAMGVIWKPYDMLVT